MNLRIASFTLVAAALAACSRDATGPALAAAARVSPDAQAAADAAPGAVYTLTNAAAGNAVAIFARAADGTLAAAGTVATGGSGTGAGLGSQGALAISGDGRWIFAVNAGSNDVSVFRVGEQGGLTLAARVPSGGTQPISAAVRGNILYVLNAGGSGDIAGFAIGTDGALTPIPGSTRALSGPAVGPAQVAFSPDGRFLVVTEKNTNLIDLFPVGSNGVAGAATTVASSGSTPFGFSFGLRDGLFVSEAGGTASSYVLDRDGSLVSVSRAVDTHQGAPCWLVVTADGRFAYTANAHSGTISGLAVGTDGSLSLLDADGVTATVGGGNIDLALSVNSRYLYQLRGGSITALAIGADGSLTTLGVVDGLPASVSGLVAR